MINKTPKWLIPAFCEDDSTKPSISSGLAEFQPIPCISKVYQVKDTRKELDNLFFEILSYLCLSELYHWVKKKKNCF